METLPSPEGRDHVDPHPAQIGPYRVLQVLGERGMGTVYLAEQHEPVQRRVALKLIKLGMDSAAIVARFERERQALALMQHDGIAKVYDCGTSERGQPYFVMEYVEGVPLADYCDDRRLPLRERLLLMCDVCAAVQHAHQKGVVHRDLKPGNVLVVDAAGAPRVKVIDFGLAKSLETGPEGATLFTQLGQVLGTPEYMAPEQADPGNIDIDTRADVYSLGVMLYELLVGELPFTGHELLEQGLREMQRILREVDPPRPSTRLSSTAVGPDAAARARRMSTGALHRALKSDLDWVVMKALEKEPDRRYESPGALAADLLRFLADEPLAAGPPSATYRLVEVRAPPPRPGARGRRDLRHGGRRRDRGRRTRSASTTCTAMSGNGVPTSTATTPGRFVTARRPPARLRRRVALQPRRQPEGRLAVAARSGGRSGCTPVVRDRDLGLRAARRLQ